MTPCVGAVDHWPAWIANPDEVSHVLRLPLDRLVGDEPGTMNVQLASLEFSAPCLVVDGHRVWGSTAVLLGELRGIPHVDIIRLGTRTPVTLPIGNLSNISRVE